MTVTCIRAEEKSGSACEKVLVHTNKTIYAAGEDMLYRVYTANPLRLQRTIDSRILYFTLRGSAGQTLEWRINLTAPDTWGRYRLPDDMIPGVYQLLVYTSQMRNLPSDSLSALNVLITSLTKTLSDTLKIPPLPGTGNRKAFSQAFAEPFPGDGPLTVTPDTLTCAMGSSNTLSVSFNGMAGDTASLSVSVSLAAPVEVTGSQDSRQVRTGSHARMASGCVYPLENHGYVVSGRLTEKETGVPVPFGKVLLSVKDTVYPQCRFARTDSSGRFSFYLDRWYDNRELVLQAGEVPGLEEFTWKLDPKSAFTGNVLPVSVVTGEAGQLAVDNQIKARLIEAIYNPVPESRVLRNHTARIDYFRPVSFSVAPADYQELVNFKEIADNILPGLKFISRNKSYVIQVINSKTGQWSEARMILLNGIPFTDFSYLSTLGTKDISRIDIITNDFLLGDYTFHGLVAVYTHDGLVPESYLKNHGLVLKNEVARAEDTPPPDTQVRISARDPDYRTGLLWMPDVKLPSGKVIALPLLASRTPGVYRVVVNGMDRRGTPVSATAQVTVK